MDEAVTEVNLCCNRVADVPVPVPGSQMRSCKDCGRDVWASIESLKVVQSRAERERAQLSFRCMQCFFQHVANGKIAAVEEPSPGQLRELARAMAGKRN
jgi:ribosome-binding protein aMBF1 (putative translation factor)